MKVLIYSKRGNNNYKEKRLIAALEEAIEKLSEKDQSFAVNFRPATNFEELKALHDKYCIENVPYEEVKSDNKTEVSEKQPKAEDTNVASDGDTSFVDPFNREEPIVRDYVLDEGMKNPGESTEQQGAEKKTSFEEPLTFDDSFSYPGAEQPGAQKKTTASSTQQSYGPTSSGSQPTQDSGRKTRSTKRFAKYIVNTICMLAEKGFVWHANRDINDAKLAEYEMTGEIDLNILLTLENGTNATIKSFFKNQCREAESLSKIGKEERDDLADALYEVLLEKKIEPTPMQELIMVGAKIFGEQAMNLLKLKAQTDSVLNQLRQMKADEAASETQQSNPAEQQKPTEQPKAQEPQQSVQLGNVMTTEPEIGQEQQTIE